MKQFLYILLFTLFAGAVSAQVVVPRSPKTVAPQDAYLYTTFGFKMPVYADTTAANAMRGHDSTGLQVFIKADTSVYVRSFGVWRKIPGSSLGGGVTTFNSRNGTVFPLTGDYSAFYPSLATTYTNPSWIGSLAASKISGAGTVSPGSSKVSLGGVPSGASLQSFSVDVVPANILLSTLGGLLGISQINATGTASSTTFLRGDGSWSSPGSTITGLPNSNLGTGYRWAYPLTNDIRTLFVTSYLTADSTSNANGLTLRADTTKLATKTDIATLTSGKVSSVSGTTNRVTSTGGLTPVIDISSTFEALLGKVANRIDQNNAATTSAQLATVVSDELGTGRFLLVAAPNHDGMHLNSEGGVAVWKDTTVSGSGSGNTNTNVGSGYRWAIPGGNTIKTFFPISGILGDSSSNTNGITIRADTNLLATKNYVNNAGDTVPIAHRGTGTWGIYANATQDSLVDKTLKGNAPISVVNNADSSRSVVADTTTALTGLATKAYVLANAGGGGGSGTVTSVSGTINRITVATGTTTPVIDISSTFEALLGKIANRIDQNNAVTTSAQLATVVTDETGTGVVVYSGSPALTGNPTAPTQTAGNNSTRIATTAYVDAAVAAGGGGSSGYSVTSAVNTANYTVPSGRRIYVTLADLTGQANRNVVLPGSPTSGDEAVFKNKNTTASTLSWTFTVGTVKDAGENTVTTLSNVTVYHLIFDGTNWNIIN